MYQPIPLLSFLALVPHALAAGGIYPSASNVLQVDASSYSRLIERSNHTSIVEFYAPWCGHCKNLAPAYEKAATTLKGLANVAAINCDEDANKPFCGQMGVQGFPTLKIVKPSKDGKRKKPSVNDYQGPREAKAIIEAVKDKIVNHVTRVKDDSLNAFLSTSTEKPKALFFSEKALVPALVKALAIDFLGAMDIGFVRTGDKKVVEKYSVASFPSVVLIPAGDAEPKTYQGEFKIASLVEFLGQAATPNPDATKGNGAPLKKKSKSTTPKAKESAEKKKPAADADESYKKEPKQAPVPVVPAEPLMALHDESSLQKACLHAGASTCVLALLSDVAAEPGLTTTRNLAEIAHKHRTRGAKLFPFYAVEATNPGSRSILDGLKLAGGPAEVPVIAINAKRGWWSRFEAEEISQASLEQWIDSIRFGEMKKQTLPEGLVAEIKEEVKAEEKAAREDVAHEEL